MMRERASGLPASAAAWAEVMPLLSGDSGSTWAASSHATAASAPLRAACHRLFRPNASGEESRAGLRWGRRASALLQDATTSIAAVLAAGVAPKAFERACRAWTLQACAAAVRACAASSGDICAVAGGARSDDSSFSRPGRTARLSAVTSPFTLTVAGAPEATADAATSGRFPSAAAARASGALAGVPSSNAATAGARLRAAASVSQSCAGACFWGNRSSAAASGVAAGVPLRSPAFFSVAGTATSIRFSTRAAFASPWAAALRYQAMALALSASTPRPRR